MQTRDLINALAADTKTQAMPIGRVWWIALAAATVMAAIAFFLLIGPRPDIGQAAQTFRFLFKFIGTLMLTISAFALLRALSRPGAPLTAAWLLLAPALVGAAVVAELFIVPAERWGAVWWGTNVYVCLTFIPLIGFLPLVIMLAALRHGAPSRPGFAGAVSGLLAGGIAATFYAAHCTDDSPLFVATWYTIAIAGLAAVGTILGRRLAPW
ncbi:NrsF family protein [Pararhizobium antarcticum]|uniref:DUF1109 family protein n=1 Tax=Pararhizobium antarcticum TaxID=1798805 RepID=A0A657LU31_9HYPH|nr:NrsF family protein [Pararhizobium antarcticum]OJF97428.1 hypothetical protein AX760_17055 [Pararhizobium antarcticum]OJF99689.1 hypothetical protein AX761_10595 [Rhizobium sp. 58]